MTASNIADFGDKVLIDPDGGEHRLGERWEKHPAVLLFLRHFGWMTCRERAGQVRDRSEDFVASGAGVTAIGTGGKRYAKAFIEDESFPFDVLLDEDGSAAEAIGTNTLGLRSLANPSAAVAGMRSLAAGGRQRRTGRRPLQLGASLIIAPGDELLYADFEDYAGDHADIDEMLAVLG